MSRPRSAPSSKPISVDHDRAADLAVLADLERQLLTRTFASLESVSDLIDDGFVEFGRAGAVHTKTETVAALIAGEEAAGWAADLADLATRFLAVDIALVTYVSFRRYDDGRTDRHSLRSSVWRRRDGRWLMLFHQGTPTALGIAAT